jgi:hypothetical protein
LVQLPAAATNSVWREFDGLIVTQHLSRLSKPLTMNCAIWTLSHCVQNCEIW